MEYKETTRNQYEGNVKILLEFIKQKGLMKEYIEFTKKVVSTALGSKDNETKN